MLHAAILDHASLSCYITTRIIRNLMRMVLDNAQSKMAGKNTTEEGRLDAAVWELLPRRA